MLCSWGDLWTTKMSLCEVIQFDGWRTSRMSIKAFPLHTCTAVLSLWYCCYWVLWICLLFTNGKEIYFIYKFLVYKLIQCDPKFSLQDRPCPRLTVSLQALLSSGSRHSKEWRPEQVVWKPYASQCTSVQLHSWHCPCSLSLPARHKTGIRPQDGRSWPCWHNTVLLKPVHFTPAYACRHLGSWVILAANQEVMGCTFLWKLSLYVWCLSVWIHCLSMFPLYS